MRLSPTMFIGCCLLSTQVWAVEQPSAPSTAARTTTSPATTSNIANSKLPNSASAVQAQNSERPLTAEQIAKNKQLQDAKHKALIQDQAIRLKQLEKANLDALAQNQELQLKNDNLAVQVQVLQSERSAQMFIYGAMTIAVGVLLGFFIASYIYTKRRRQW